MRIALIGLMFEGSLTYFYKKAFEKLADIKVFPVGSTHFPIDTKPAPVFSKLWNNRITYRLKMEVLNKRLLKFILSQKPDVTIFFKGTEFFPETIEKIRGKTYLINIFNDDIFYPVTSSKFAVQSIKFFDMYLTPCKFNIPELKDRGAKRVEYLPFGYDEDFHKPVADAYNHDVLFIGTYRPEREELFIEFIKDMNYSFFILGNYWYNVKNKELKRFIAGKPIYPNKISYYHSTAKINIALNTYFGNRERRIHTMRHFEIPASGGFMISEYNEELREFFSNDVVYFLDAADLKDRVNYFLKSDRERMENINLLKKHLKGNSYHDRARFILSLL